MRSPLPPDRLLRFTFHLLCEFAQCGLVLLVLLPLIAEMAMHEHGRHHRAGVEEATGRHVEDHLHWRRERQIAHAV
jgi:hypothetical protein